MTVQQPPGSSIPNPYVPYAGTTNDKLVLSKDGIWKTFQGEGPRLGQQTTFMRLAGCNLACSWCDTPYTWDWTGKNGHQYIIKDEVHPNYIQMVLHQIVDLGCQSLTITGGEPLLQYKALNGLFEAFYNSMYVNFLREVNFETNGTVFPEWSDEALEVMQPITYVISPKLKNSGNPLLDYTAITKFLEMYGAGDLDMELAFKFVCNSPEDLREVAAIQDHINSQVGPPLPNRIMWIMAEGVSPGLQTNRTREMADLVLEEGWNLTTRFHLQLWGNERAR